MDPEFAEAYNNRGLAYSEKGDADKAAADRIKAIELDTNGKGGTDGGTKPDGGTVSPDGGTRPDGGTAPPDGGHPGDGPPPDDGHPN